MTAEKGLKKAQAYFRKADLIFQCVSEINFKLES